MPPEGSNDILTYCEAIVQQDDHVEIRDVGAKVGGNAIDPVVAQKEDFEIRKDREVLQATDFIV